MIKKLPVKAMYQLCLYCDECGEKMFDNPKGVVLTSDPIKMGYVCKNGHETLSPYQFPCQLTIFDEDKAEVVSEEEWNSLVGGLKHETSED